MKPAMLHYVKASMLILCSPQHLKSSMRLKFKQTRFPLLLFLSRFTDNCFIWAIWCGVGGVFCRKSSTLRIHGSAWLHVCDFGTRMRFRNRLAFGGSCSLNLPDRLRFGCKRREVVNFSADWVHVVFHLSSVCCVLFRSRTWTLPHVVTADCAKFI